MKSINTYINESKLSVENVFDKIFSHLDYLDPSKVLNSLFQYLDVDTLADYYETYCALWDFDYKENLKDKETIEEEFDKILDAFTPTEVLSELMGYMNVDELNDFYEFLIKEYGLDDEE